MFKRLKNLNDLAEAARFEAAVYRRRQHPVTRRHHRDLVDIYNAKKFFFMRKLQYEV